MSSCKHQIKHETLNHKVTSSLSSTHTHSCCGSLVMICKTLLIPSSSGCRCQTSGSTSRWWRCAIWLKSSTNKDPACCRGAALCIMGTGYLPSQQEALHKAVRWITNIIQCSELLFDAFCRTSRHITRAPCLLRSVTDDLWDLLSAHNKLKQADFL